MEIAGPDRTPERYVIFEALHTGRMGVIMIGSAKKQVKTVCYCGGGIGKGGVNLWNNVSEKERILTLNLFASKEPNARLTAFSPCSLSIKQVPSMEFELWIAHDKIPSSERFGPQINNNQCGRLAERRILALSATYS